MFTLIERFLDDPRRTMNAAVICTAAITVPFVLAALFMI